MKTTLNSYFLYPLILVYVSFLKGMKKEYRNFFMDKSKELKKDSILKLISNNWEFSSCIEYFFDKTSPFYEKVSITFQIDVNQAPEEKKYYMYDFFHVLKSFYAVSIISKRTSNENINIALEFEKQRLNNTQINNLLRYNLLAYGSGRIDTIYFDKKLIKDERSLLAYETMLSYLDGAKRINFSKNKHLHVLTIEKNTRKYDIVWSSAEDIELTDFGTVYDKYGKELKRNIKITNSPIYALHK